MEEKTLFEKMGGTYTTQGDYLLPDLSLPEQPRVTLGRYAHMRKKFLRSHHKVIYYNYLTSGTLVRHLMEVEQTALELEEHLLTQMAKQENVTEELKAADQMTWVRKMNNICSRAREIVLTEIIYA